MTPLRVPLREFRDGKGWTIAQLATESGVSRATIIRLEQGRTKGIDFETLESLADALGVEPGRLVQRVSAKRRD